MPRCTLSRNSRRESYTSISTNSKQWRTPLSVNYATRHVLTKPPSSSTICGSPRSFQRRQCYTLLQNVCTHSFQPDFDLQSSGPSPLRPHLAQLPKLDLTLATLPQSTTSSPEPDSSKYTDVKPSDMTRLNPVLAQLPKLVVEEPLRVFPHHDVKTFQYFPKLPTELRVNIWAMAASEPRFTHLAIERSILRMDDYEENEHVLVAKGQRAVPSILHTNGEARLEGLKYYKLYFEQDLVDRKEHGRV